MKALIQPYLQSQGINEDYIYSMCRFSTEIKNIEGNYILEFPQWFFTCPKPEFTSQQIEDALKAELLEAKIDGLKNKFSGSELEAKLAEINSLEKIEEIENFII